MLTKTDIDAITPDESIELAMLLWDHAYDAVSKRPLSEEQKHELDRRLESSLSHPAARSWKVVMAELEAKYAGI